MNQVEGNASADEGGAKRRLRRQGRGHHAVLDAGAAQLAAWCLLGLLNQILIIVRLPAASTDTRLLHHAYDAGQLLALGVLSLVFVRLAQLGLPRLPRAIAGRWARAALVGAAVFVVSMATVDEDVSNLASRLDVRLAFVRVAASLAFGVALSATLLLRRVASGPVRPVLFIVGVAVAVGNAFLLDGDYFTLHLMAAWLGALLIGYALEGSWVGGLGRWCGLGRPSRMVGVGLLAAAGAAAVLVPPRNDVLRRMYCLSSSVVAPIAGRYYPDRTGIELDKVPARYRHSPWFRDRSRQPTVPPSRVFRPKQPPIVLFFTIEAMRADVLEKRKYERYLPELHKLRKTSTHFTMARAVTSATTTSLASVFACKYYSQLRWDAEGDSKVRLLDDSPRFAEVLSKAGVRTVHVATQGRLRADTGVGTGFQHQYWIPISKTRGAQALDKLIEDLDKNPQVPYFAYTHFIESHAPYDLAGTKGSEYDRYVREIGIVDRELGRLRQHLDEKGLAGNTIFIISGDHGEAFGEHGARYHSKNVYEEAMRVPLIVHVPGMKPRKSSVPVSLIDVGPTVLDLFGAATPGIYMGQSLVPLVAGKPAKLTRPIAVDTGRRIQALYLDDGKKVIIDLRKHTVEVYDLGADPGEVVNLVEHRAPDVEAAIETTKLFFEVHRRKDLGYEPPWQKF
ncbi:MAG: sulfatase-like hydrolase/transferase [Polyangiaceae bacterium]|nr:sulfatase-like hydrolase/transferase [Polyangiaceae bacterium]